MKAREEMPLLRCALGPTGRPFGDGLHSVTASGTDGRKAVITRNWDMAGSTLKKPIRGRKMGVGASNLNKLNLILFSFLLYVLRFTIPYLEGRYYTLSLNKAISMVVNLRNIYDSLTISLLWVFRNLRRFDCAHY